MIIKFRKNGQKHISDLPFLISLWPVGHLFASELSLSSASVLFAEAFSQIMDKYN